MSLTIGRLVLDDPADWPEPVGEGFDMVGGAPVPAARQGIRFQVPLDVWQGAASNVAALRQAARRQLRSLLANTPYCLSGVYVLWTEDTDQSGWYVLSGATVKPAGSAGLYASSWVADGLELGLVGRGRTHRRATQGTLLDRRLATSPRDYRRLIYSTDFSGLTPLALTALPSDATDVVVHGMAVPPARTVALAGYSSLSAYLLVGLADMAVASCEQAEVARNRGDVVIYDRRGTTTMLTTGPQTAWEEVYGADYPFTAADAPVIENGYCRVSYDSANTDGLRVDVWTGSAWAEQGKVLIQRYDGSYNYLDTLVAATVLEWTPERGVLSLIMRRAADAYSREEVIVTLQRGWTGPRVEVYPARTSAGAVAGAAVAFTVQAADTNDSAACVDAAAGGATQPTAGSGSALWSALAIGAATFNGENWVSVIREGGAYDVHLTALLAACDKRVASGSEAYGSNRNTVLVRHTSAGWVGTRLAFTAHDTHQELDNGDFTAGSGTTLSAADGTAIGGTAASTTRTTDANAHVTLATWLTGRRGRYRLFARVRTTASTLNIYAKTAATTGATKTTTSTSYVWVDLGDIIADGSTLEIHMWATAAATTFFDRLECFRVEGRDTGDLRYDGARDLGQADLYDARTYQRVVAR